MYFQSLDMYGSYMYHVMLGWFGSFRVHVYLLVCVTNQQKNQVDGPNLVTKFAKVCCEVMETDFVVQWYLVPLNLGEASKN